MTARKALSEFISEANLKHNNKYDYSLVEYTNAFTKIRIICPLHGEFLQRPHDHISNKKPGECPVCANISRSIKTKKEKSYTNEKFLELAKKTHGNLYNYDYSEYTGMLNHILINCKIHGKFSQAAHSHINGSGCPKCGLGNKSKIEKIWLDLNKIPKRFRQYCIKIDNKRHFVDGYDPSTNTVYEFYGDFWHGNPKKFNLNEINPFLNKTFGDLYQTTILREQMFLSLGFKINTIWESEFKEYLNTSSEKGHK